MPKRRGVDGRLWVGFVGQEEGQGGAWVGYQRIELTDRTKTWPVTNTEFKPGNPDYEARDDSLTAGQPDRFAAKIGDVREGRVTFVNATWSDEANLFGAPLRLHAGKYYRLLLAPYRGEDQAFHDLGNLVCVTAGHTLIIPGAQPVNLEFETDGSYRLAGELGGL